MRSLVISSTFTKMGMYVSMWGLFSQALGYGTMQGWPRRSTFPFSMGKTALMCTWIPIPSSEATEKEAPFLSMELWTLLGLGQ